MEVQEITVRVPAGLRVVIETESESLPAHARLLELAVNGAIGRGALINTADGQRIATEGYNPRPDYPTADLAIDDST